MKEVLQIQTLNQMYQIVEDADGPCDFCISMGDVLHKWVRINKTKQYDSNGMMKLSVYDYITNKEHTYSFKSLSSARYTSINYTIFDGRFYLLKRE